MAEDAYREVPDWFFKDRCKDLETQLDKAKEELVDHRKATRRDMWEKFCNVLTVMVITAGVVGAGFAASMTNKGCDAKELAAKQIDLDKERLEAGKEPCKDSVERLSSDSQQHCSPQASLRVEPKPGTTDILVVCSCPRSSTK